MSLHAYHPGTGASLTVDEGQLTHMRASGWMLRSEWEQNEAARAEREQSDSQSAAKAKAAAKSTDEGK